MNATLKNLLDEIEFGEPQSFRNITVLPLKSSHRGRQDYLTLGEALSSGTFQVTEVTQGGSVPELKVLNDGDKPVLLLDGEELLGAKQNRILNTTILLREKSATVIPVSCAERGRWAYTSPVFSESDALLAHKLRWQKLRSVSASLEQHADFKADQHEVWHGIAAFHAKAKLATPSEAMHDVFQQRAEELRQGLANCPVLHDQRGLLVLIDDEVAGFDWVSRETAYCRLHQKLLKSYLLESLLDAKPGAAPTGRAKAKAVIFLEQAAACATKEFPSVGYGLDCRCKGQAIAGSALIHENEVIHTAFFRIGEEKSEMAPMRNRRRTVWPE